MKAYKVFNNDWTCKGFQYEIGETYEIDVSPILCNIGFHACKKAVDCFNYYDFNPENKVAEVELLGKIVGEDEDKQATNKIKVVREISWSELLELVNSGDGNSGYRNSGDWNSGNWNSGYRNSGYRNSGDENSGYRNSGNWNSGNRNSGYRNSGDENSGDRNSGDWNSGNWNSGNRNSGNRNSGYRNSGDENSGYRNSGNWNSGNRNSGNRNSGYRNSGDRNSGDWNSGDWNSGDWNSGYLNSNTPDKIRVFNKEISIKEWDIAEKPNLLYFDLKEWVHSDKMTEEEKLNNPEHEKNNGYLKTFGFKEAFKNSYENATEEDRELLKELPNFDADIFFEISGIRVD